MKRAEQPPALNHDLTIEKGDVGKRQNTVKPVEGLAPERKVVQHCLRHIAPSRLLPVQRGNAVVFHHAMKTQSAAAVEPDLDDQGRRRSRRVLTLGIGSEHSHAAPAF